MRAIAKILLYLSVLFLSIYSLVLSGCGGGKAPSQTTQQDTVPVPVISLTINPTAVFPGQSATLSWTATSASSCTADGSWSGSQQMNGSMNVSLSSAATQSYVLYCANSIGKTVRSSVTLSLSPADGACTTSHAAVTASGRRVGKRRSPNGPRS